MKLPSPWNTNWKYIFLMCFIFLVKSVSLSFDYVLGICDFSYTFYYSNLIAQSIQALTLPEKFIISSTMNISVTISYLPWSLDRIWYIFQKLKFRFYCYCYWFSLYCYCKTKNINRKYRQKSIYNTIYSIFYCSSATSSVRNLGNM